MADGDDLTGVWEGQYSYPYRQRATPFTAVLLQSGSHIGGQVHEISDMGFSRGQTLIASLEGQRSGAAVSFVKTYEPGPDHKRPVRYRGRLNAEATEIEGTWTILAIFSGRFIMVRTRRAEAAAGAETAVETTVRATQPAL